MDEEVLRCRRASRVRRWNAQFEFLFTLSADVGELISLGPCPLGERRVVYITSGTFEGPAMRGGSWAAPIGRSCAATALSSSTRVTRSGTSVAQSCRSCSQGYRHGPPEVMAKLARGEDVDPASYFFRTTMRFETGASELAWLNKTIAVATAERKARRVEVRAYRLL